MNKKIIVVVGLIWLGLISFIMMNFNLYMLLGLLVGITYRVFHGTAISFACGITLGVLFVQICKFITFKM